MYEGINEWLRWVFYTGIFVNFFFFYPLVQNIPHNILYLYDLRGVYV